MKKITFFILFSLLFACNFFKKDKAIAYNDKIIDKQITLIQNLETLFSSFETYNLALIDSNFNVSLQNANEMESFGKKLADFDNSVEFKEAFLFWIGEIKSVLKIETTLLINLLKIPDEEYTFENENNYKKLFSSLEKKMSIADDSLLTAQKQFAKKYRFKLLEK